MWKANSFSHRDSNRAKGLDPPFTKHSTIGITCVAREVKEGKRRVRKIMYMLAKRIRVSK